ncbi:protein THEMIS2 isoform X2 [Spea bombifrons]|uniref:protein THEMIS2 isoform X2 n=1 Tax=Spea bombifrons TaxID=233779 RepID=UPI002349A74D|nr:protein THEMIS2 isoform X2 [Spea bombifrons]
MEELENAVPLSDFIISLPASSLPRIIKIACGVYQQSSIYDIQGTECSLSTGDVLKVISKRLKSVSLVDSKTGKYHHLPVNFQGLFEISEDTCIYNNFGALHNELCSGGYTHGFWFSSLSDMIIGGQLIRRHIPIQYMSTETYKKCKYANCQMYVGPKALCLKIPFSKEGQFYEHKALESYSLDKILQSPILLKSCLRCSEIGNGSYIVCPVYEIATVMHMRKDLVIMQSSLEVDVIDITDNCGVIDFVKPLSLTEASECEDKFPIVAEILDNSKYTSFLKSDIFSALRKGKKIVIHKKFLSRKVLATASKGKLSSFFYIHDSYKGMFRQRPREFSTIYDLWIHAVAGTKLNVVVTQDSECLEGSFPSLGIGDHLKVLHHTTRKISTKDVDFLVCRKELAAAAAADDDDDESEEIVLPLNLEGRFVEEITNNKKYSLNSLIQTLTLPCEVKVVAKDPSMNCDPLCSFSLLKLEELIEEPVLLIGFQETPSECFELPIKYSDVSLVFLEDPVPPSKEPNMVAHVEELTECFYYSIRKDQPCKELPPPRPPKRQTSLKVERPYNNYASEKNPASIKASPTAFLNPLEKHIDTPQKSMSCMSNPNTSTPRIDTVEEEFQYDHDYEEVRDEMFSKLKVTTKKTY